MNTKGFTLLEVLLVLLIISGLVFIVSINLPETKKNSQSTKEFERLFIQLNNLYDESVLFNRSYLVTFTDNKYFSVTSIPIQCTVGWFQHIANTWISTNDDD